MYVLNIKPEASLLSDFHNMFTMIEGQSRCSFNEILAKVAAMVTVLLEIFCIF